jgi:hypothetical protein
MKFLFSAVSIIVRSLQSVYQCNLHLCQYRTINFTKNGWYVSWSRTCLNRHAQMSQIVHLKIVLFDIYYFWKLVHVFVLKVTWIKWEILGLYIMDWLCQLGVISISNIIFNYKPLDYSVLTKNSLIGLQCFQTLFWECLSSSFYCFTFRSGIFHSWSQFARYSGGFRNFERGGTNRNSENVLWDIARCSEWGRHARKGEGRKSQKKFGSQILNSTTITS